MMYNLDNNQHEMMIQYSHLLTVVEEGFDYVEEQYQLEKWFEGDRMLGDVFLAFTQFEKTNQLMNELFKNETTILNDIQKFDTVISIVADLEKVYELETERKRVVLNRLIPAFSAWKEILDVTFKPYIQH
ncbi:hypothetical protein [Pseudalkalibacillus berkeleyi]|uniref:DUF8042 domain-containing protein n=1 Tax=Pseudalkalibacillus berkeleyi TaxID=1069813 RepID=A0ABS9H175_9BACL|nr:hypothetical protein [Pseudalkalibacillus berkeleyi]MCF6138747.1 hypothetical protein [Pseudalkalibacillus berkeleyi]